VGARLTHQIAATDTRFSVIRDDTHETVRFRLCCTFKSGTGLFKVCAFLSINLSALLQVEIQLSKKSPVIHLRNPDILVGKDDLTELSYLHEPAGKPCFVQRSMCANMQFCTIFVFVFRVVNVFTRTVALYLWPSIRTRNKPTCTVMK
jgi:hypothetical protein